MAASVTRILVPTDFSAPADAALAYAKTLAAWLGASLHLVHVFKDPYGFATCEPGVFGAMPLDSRDRAMAEVDEELGKRLDDSEAKRFRGTAAVVRGLAAKEIVRYATANGIDQIVIGAHGRRGIAHMLLGSVAEHVARIAECPVLAVPGAPADRAVQEARLVSLSHVHDGSSLSLSEALS